MYRAAFAIIALLVFPTLAPAQQPCTTDARHVVNELYRHMLERQADPGSEHWVQQLQSGQMTVREVVASIAKSNEHLNRFFRTESGEGTPYERSVGTFYRHILGRQPDAGGQATYARMAQERGAEAVIDALIGSREYTRQFADWGVPGSGGVQYCAPGRQTTRGRIPDDEMTTARIPDDEMRFDEMDRNNDGIVTRREWRGTRRSFRLHDWNRDGVLSGEEVRTGATQSGLSDNRFELLDLDEDGFVERWEWEGSGTSFARLDRNRDNVLDRFEYERSLGAVGTTGGFVIVDASDEWTDTGVQVRRGDMISFDVDEGMVRLSGSRNDVAGPDGSGRRAANAPIPRAPAGALIGRIGNSDAFFIGSRRSIRAPASGRLFLGVNDDHFPDNSGSYRVQVMIE